MCQRTGFISVLFFHEEEEGFPGLPGCASARLTRAPFCSYSTLCSCAVSQIHSQFQQAEFPDRRAAGEPEPSALP
jgi:hypothetical protein